MVYNFSSRGSDTLFWPPQVFTHIYVYTHTYAHTYTQTHTDREVYIISNKIFLKDLEVYVGKPLEYIYTHICIYMSLCIYIYAVTRFIMSHVNNINNR